jgi:uncharacterized membrane protein
MFAKNRLDALTDGIFGVAMTLLVLDVRLPDDFHPQDSAEMLKGLAGIWPKFLPYVISFVVLGLRWLGSIEARTRAEFLSRDFASWWLLYLLLITFVPFSTMIVGRYVSFEPAIWLYAGHTLLIALVSMRMVALTPDLEPGPHLRHRQISSLLLAVSSILAIALSFLSTRVALWAIAINFLQPVLERWRAQAKQKGARPQAPNA